MKLFQKRQNLSVLKMRLGRINSMEYEHFSTGKSKELAARTSGSAHSLCQNTALQIVKRSLLVLHWFPHTASVPSTAENLQVITASQNHSIVLIGRDV